MSKKMDVYLLPRRNGEYSLYAGVLEAPSAPAAAESDSKAKKWLALGRKGYDWLTWRRQQRELLLKELGSLRSVRILYPSSLPPEQARVAYDHLLQQAAAKHRKWMLVNTAALPASVPLTLIPGPNVVLAYLAWRSVSHYKTKKASERAAALAIDFVPEQRLAELAELVRRWPFRARRKIREIGAELGLDRLDRAY